MNVTRQTIRQEDGTDFIVLRIIDVTQEKIAENAELERNSNATSTACNSHEMKNPLQSINAQVENLNSR